MKLQVSGSAPVPAVGLSETAVEQILLTLISNAREALGDDAGQVTIELAESRLTTGLSLRVVDTGPGIPSETRDQVWEPFFTTKGEEHMGLGLSTLWATVRRHGGSVELSSDKGAGTAISMVFPPASLEMRSPEKRRRDSGLSHPREHTVLILEDELPIRTALRRVLKHSGLEVVEAGTVSEARAALQGRRFALLISDGVLPDGGVGAFIQDFRKQQRSPVILCSGYLEEDLALEGISKGECSFLPKPFLPEELTDLVESLLAEEGSSD
jgi:CheY-like chemotaxis protein